MSYNELMTGQDTNVAIWECLKHDSKQTEREIAESNATVRLMLAKSNLLTVCS